jgi:threonine synthase
MDVGNPSNLERLRALYPDLDALRGAVSADWVGDDAIKARIHKDFVRYGLILCPHTATAAEVFERMPLERRENGRWVLVGTAHPAKFREIVEPLIGQAVSMPPSLAKLYELPARAVEIDAGLEALRAAL